MSIPNLLDPVPVEIRQIDRGTTFEDPDAREPIQQAARKNVVIVQGQAKWGAQLQRGHERGGSTEGSAGYVLFRIIDLNAKSITLGQNDRFSKIGNIDTDVYIERLEFTAHYADQGGPTLVKAHFRDRQPGKQLRGT